MDHLASRALPARTRAIAALALIGLASAVAPARAADVDLSAGVLSYSDTTVLSPLIANALDISLAGGTYTIDDPAEAAITLTTNALAQDCAAFDSNTVTCPAAAITSFFISIREGDDHVTLAGAAHPAIVTGGRGNDTLVGGNANDTFDWNPGEGSDTIDGGPGDDTLAFFGSNAPESITITPDGTGFDLFRNVAAIQMVVQNTEALALTTIGGTDTVVTTPLVNTAQDIVDGLLGADDGLPDVLRVDAGGLCLTRQNDTFEVAGRQPIHFANFPQVFVDNAFCPPDPCDGAVVTQGCTVNHVRNQPCQGTAGDDVIVGTAAGDVSRGGGGRDRILGRSGDDLLCGEEGDDVLSGGSGDDTLRSDNGDDRLRGGGDADTLQGGAGVDRIDGGSGDDQCADTDEVGPFLRCEQP